jgi:hypothetical protein
MGRKSRAKAAHREARARAAIAVPVAAVVDAPSVVGSAPPPTPRYALPTEPRLPAQSSGFVDRVDAVPRPVRNPPPTGDCDRLRDIALQLAAVQQALEEEVRLLVHGGHSWTEIGRALGLSRQGARQRYRRLLSVEAPR